MPQGQIFSRKLRFPPSNITGDLALWLRELWVYVESQPNISIFSGNATATPNSTVTGMSGDLAVNVGSASTDSRLWIKGGGTRNALDQSGWVVVRIGQP